MHAAKQVVIRPFRSSRAMENARTRSIRCTACGQTFKAATGSTSCPTCEPGSVPRRPDIETVGKFVERRWWLWCSPAAGLALGWILAARRVDLSWSFCVVLLTCGAAPILYGLFAIPLSVVRGDRVLPRVALTLTWCLTGAICGVVGFFVLLMLNPPVFP